MIGCLCINLDITETVRLEEFLKRYNSYEIEEDNAQSILPTSKKHAEANTVPSDSSSNPPSDSEVFANNITEVLEFLIAQADKRAGKPVDELSREEKIEFVRYLDQKGAFLVTKSSERICEHLKVSRFTLYNYLDLIRKESNTNTETNKEE